MKLILPITSKVNLKQHNIKGLGDLVAIVAEPIKTAIINHAPTRISNMMKNCNCNKRKVFLNKILPL